MGGARQRPINPPQSRRSTHAPTGPGAFSDMQSDGLIVVPYARGTIGTRTVASLSRPPVLASARRRRTLPTQHFFETARHGSRSAGPGVMRPSQHASHRHCGHEQRGREADMQEDEHSAMWRTNIFALPTMTKVPAQTSPSTATSSRHSVRTMEQPACRPSAARPASQRRCNPWTMLQTHAKFAFAEAASTLAGKIHSAGFEIQLLGLATQLDDIRAARTCSLETPSEQRHGSSGQAWQHTYHHQRLRANGSRTIRAFLSWSIAQLIRLRPNSTSALQPAQQPQT